MIVYFVVLYPTLKGVLTCCAFGFILSNLLNALLVCGFELKYEDTLNTAVGNSLTNSLFLLNNCSTVCIHLNDVDIVPEFLEAYKNDYEFSILIVEELKRNIMKTCGGIVAFESNSSTKCGEVDKFLSTTRTLFYFLNDRTMAVITRLGACLAVAQSQEVFALSLSDNSLFQLSPVYRQPRHFIRTSVAEVLQRQDTSTKLKLEGTTVKVAIMNYIPFIIFENGNTTDLQLDELDGIEALLLKELARQLNVRVLLEVCDGWGAKLSNGSWSGGIAQHMQDGKADLAFANLWQILSNYENFDLGPSLTKIKLGFLVRRPQRIDFRWQSFVTIFQHQVWFALLASFVCVVAAYWAGLQLDIHSCKESWSSCLLTILGYFVMSYSRTREGEGNTRYTLTSWSVFSLLFTTSLTSGIINRLSISLYEDRVDSLQQLVEGQYFWTVQYYRDYNNDSDLIESLFDFKNQWARMFEKTYKYMDSAEVSMKIKTNQKITFPVQRYGNDFIIIDNFGLHGNKALYDFRLSTEEVTSCHIAFAVKKNSPLLEQISVATLKILEAGLVSHWKEDVVRRWPQYDTKHLLIEQDIPTFSGPQKLQMNKLQPIFYVLLFGSIFSFCVFLVEIFGEETTINKTTRTGSISQTTYPALHHHRHYIN